jgi:hypothetical protein
MNELVARNSASLVVIPVRLHDRVQHWRDIPDDLRSGWRPVYDPEAAAVAAALIAEQKKMAPDGAIAEWLMRLNDAVAANLEPEQLARRVSVTVNVLGEDLPAYCWTNETFKLASRRFKWFPTVAELSDLLEPIKVERQQTIDLILRMSQRAISDRIEGGVESKTPYPVIPAPPGTPAPHFDPKTTFRTEPGVESIIQKPIRTVEEQLASLGFASDGKTPL